MLSQRVGAPSLFLLHRIPLCKCTIVFLLNFKLFYCCSITVVCIFSPPLYPTPAKPTSLPCFHTPHPCYCPCVLYNCSCKPFTLFPWNSLPSPLWSLSAFSQFQCLWLYFACLFVLLIMFLIKVRSSGICLSPPGLFHLEKYSWVPSMLLWRVGVPSFFPLHSIPLCKCTIVFDPLTYWWALWLFPTLGYCK